VARPYWRMVVLDAYYDGGFMVSPRVVRDHRKGRNYIFHFQHEQGTVLDDSVWTLYIEGGISSYLPTGDVFRSFRFKNRTDIQMHDLTRVFQTTEINASTLSIRYNGLRFDGVIPFGSEDHQLMGQNPAYQNTENASYLKDVSFPETLLVLPEGNPNRRVLSDALRRIGFQESMSVEEFSNRAVLYLQRGRGYSLESEIPEGDADRLLRWVASGQAGHCELYAGAFVLLARSAGIPARMVTGFVGGDWNGFENYFMVRNRNAHAWCEVLDPKRGWVRVDPTPGYAVDPGSVDEALAGGNLEFDRTFKAYLDSLSILWFRRVIQFDGTDQQEMAEIMKGAGLKGFDWIKDHFQRMKEQFKSDWESISLRGEWSGLVSGSLVPLFSVGLIFVIPILLWRRGHRRGFEEIMRRKAGRFLRDRKMRGLPDECTITDSLNLIRYGPVSSWPERPARFLASKMRQKESG
jgi:transglutaminase-like putative cysteine protease